MAIEVWLALLSASILISLSPGAGAATAMSYGLSHGVRGAAPAVAGLIAGYGTQLLIVAVGLGSLVATSPTLFQAIKWIGAGYLIWLGIGLWRDKGKLSLRRTDEIKKHRHFISAYLVNITNPKGMVFFGRSGASVYGPKPAAWPPITGYRRDPADSRLERNDRLQWSGFSAEPTDAKP